MAIVVKLDDVLHARRMTLTELAERVGITLVNLSILKTGSARCGANKALAFGLDRFIARLRPQRAVRRQDVRRRKETVHADQPNSGQGGTSGPLAGAAEPDSQNATCCCDKQSIAYAVCSARLGADRCSSRFSVPPHRRHRPSWT
jgi:hypothetical protein